MKRLFQVYRALAFVVGVLLVILTVGVILKYSTDYGTWHDRGDSIVGVVGFIHGWLYLVYFVLAFFLATKSRWPVVFTVLMLAAGLIPLLIFWVERQVERRLRDEHPEYFAEPAAAP